MSKFIQEKIVATTVRTVETARDVRGPCGILMSFDKDSMALVIGALHQDGVSCFTSIETLKEIGEMLIEMSELLNKERSNNA